MILRFQCGLLQVIPKLRQTGIESIVDPFLEDEYPRDILYNMADLALKCTSLEIEDRPTMRVLTIHNKKFLPKNVSSFVYFILDVELDFDQCYNNIARMAGIPSPSFVRYPCGCHHHAPDVADGLIMSEPVTTST